MEPFPKALPHCPKCTSRMTRREFGTFMETWPHNEFVSTGKLSTCLRWTCDDCGFRKLTKTADARTEEKCSDAPNELYG